MNIYSTRNYLEKGESVLLTGTTGCGKSFFTPALGHQTRSQGNKVLYPEVTDEAQKYSN
ncbi:ATP-binding protein [Gramella sp. AN32]|uniref:ATP-binding protein n=1 Tax=Christiangramia antarctica TaxID=2058158 RepID=A0ABW5X379_9FLAO|nr:ATP-binding protein [Gramella sp. AN32]MCM4155769.1 hypothetical protein [Gramella sp. AN32]